MPVPAIQTSVASSPRSPRASKPHRPVPRYAAVDDAWTVSGVFLIAALVLGAAYCVWRAYRPAMETLPPVIVEATALPTPAFMPYPQSRERAIAGTLSMPTDALSLPMADQPVGWGDLTLMLRAGLGDADIIDALRGKQLAVTVGPAQAATLRELGAGDRLLNDLRTRTVYPVSGMTPGVALPTPVLLRHAPVPANRAAQAIQTPPLPTPIDYAARDRQVKDLQSRIDAIDAQILQIRNHPDSLSLFGNYNGRGYYDGAESPLKKILDQLDKQRNELRRQKWQLEGR